LTLANWSSFVSQAMCAYNTQQPKYNSYLSQDNATEPQRPKNIIHQSTEPQCAKTPPSRIIAGCQTFHLSSAFNFAKPTVYSSH